MAEASTSWADEAEAADAGLGGGDLGGGGPPPGFEAVAEGTHAQANAAELAAALEGAAIGGAGGAAEDPDAPDAPDIALKSGVLQDSEEAVELRVADDTPYSSAATFEDLHLSRELLDGLYNEMKFERPSKIQAKTLPLIILPPCRNLIAQAHNGSGKTTCFVLGMLSKVDPAVREPQALCICPTRELVVQNEQVLAKMAKYTGITCATTASDDDSHGSRPSRRERIVDQVVIGTPGRLKTWTTKKVLGLKTVKILVFDEADHMLEANGFREDSTMLMARLNQANPRVQILLFSATFSDDVKSFAMRTVRDANMVFLEKEKLSLDKIKQYQVIVDSVEAKDKLLKESIFPNCEKLGQTIIFVRSKRTARALHASLKSLAFTVSCIEGDMQHSDRDKCIEAFREGRTKILIATDVLSRGFDHSSVTLVINFDMPVQHNNQRVPAFETYMHRVGRTGRFGRRGIAFNLVMGPEEKRISDAIQQHFNHPTPTISFQDEDRFEQVLEEAGLA